MNTPSLEDRKSTGTDRHGRTVADRADELDRRGFGSLGSMLRRLHGGERNPGDRVAAILSAEPRRDPAELDRWRARNALLCQPASAPCPSWCQLGHGHGYEETRYEPDDGPAGFRPAGFEIRYHSRLFLADGTGGVEVVQPEDLKPDGSVSLREPEIQLFDGCSGPLTPESARAVASALTRAAALVSALRR